MQPTNADVAKLRPRPGLRPAPIAYTIAGVVGGIGWLAISQLTHRREAWDSELYFSWFLPSLALVLAALGFFAPDRAWRWAFAPFGAQAVVAFLQNPTANLLPLGLLVFAFYGALCTVPTWLGARLRRRFEPIPAPTAPPPGAS